MPGFSRPRRFLRVHVTRNSLSERDMKTMRGNKGVKMQLGARRGIFNGSNFVVTLPSGSVKIHGPDGEFMYYRSAKQPRAPVGRQP